jgi:hypothetical protein
MKNQYFGDLNDYLKYSLLRLLGGDGKVGMAVCWVLTEDDGGIDGRRVGYLAQPGTWQKYDPIVFDHLRKEVLDRGNRRVRAIEQAAVFRNCRFFSEIIRDDERLRDAYFEKFFKFATDADLIFFDPDNGLGVKSIPRGRKGSCKYIYQDEVETAYSSGHSVLLYQHFPRKPRGPFIQGIVQQLGTLNGLKNVISFSSSHVVFLLLPQPHHEDMLHLNTTRFAHRWASLIQIGNHRVCRETLHLLNAEPGSIAREMGVLLEASPTANA